MRGEISPVDGRYQNKTKELRKYFSEQALNRVRVKVEVEYLIVLSSIGVAPAYTSVQKEQLRSLYKKFTEKDYEIIKQIETTGYKSTSKSTSIKATNHDVKAVEYFIAKKMKDLGLNGENYLHFAITSEDVNNLAYNTLITDFVKNIVLSSLTKIAEVLITLTRKNKEIGMLGFTHAQPATPTTLGKEFAVHLSRLVRKIKQISKIKLAGKLAGATGTYSAHMIAHPEIDWIEFSKKFINSLGLKPSIINTQIGARDELAELFHLINETNSILIELARDVWLYILKDYLRIRAKEGEVGSSTMPHKVNPIDFENAEGNLEKANSDLNFLAEYLTKTRLQRDLSDSTVMRNVGVAFAHSIIGYKSCVKGLVKIEANLSEIKADLEKHPEVLGEAIQTLMRKENIKNAYELVRDVIRGAIIKKEDLEKLVGRLTLKEREKNKLLELIKSPEKYSGYAEKLAEMSAEKAEKTLDLLKKGWK